MNEVFATTITVSEATYQYLKMNPDFVAVLDENNPKRVGMFRQGAGEATIDVLLDESLPNMDSYFRFKKL